VSFFVKFDQVAALLEFGASAEPLMGRCDR
jgi:hypothetical protein